MKIPLINLKNFRRKLLSLGLAIILWFFVTENSVLVDQKTVDVQYRGLPDNVIIVESLQKISYTITKNPYYPNNIKINITPYVDVKDSSPGWHTFPVKMDLSSPLPTYANIHLSVNSARVLLDNKSAKNVLIKPDIEVSNPADFSVTNIRVNPSITQLVGPESVLENIKTIFLDTINVSHSGDFKIDAEVLSPATSVSVRDKKVSLQFSVYSNYITKIITVPVATKNLSSNLSLETISVKEVTLRLRGLKSQFDAIEENPYSIVFLDLLHIDSKGVYPKVPIHIELPNGMTLLNTRNIPNNADISINTISSDTEETKTASDQQIDKKNMENQDTDAESIQNEEHTPVESMPFLLETPYTNPMNEKNPSSQTGETKKITPEKKEENSIENSEKLDDNTN